MTNAPEPPPSAPEPSPTPSPAPGAAEKAERARLIGLVVLAIVVLWFILANTRTARTTWWIATVTSPMWLTLAGTFAGGMATVFLLTRTRIRDVRRKKG